MVELRKFRKILTGVWVFLTLAVAGSLLFSVINQRQAPEVNESEYIRANQNGGVIVFVHGVQGNSKETWTNPVTKAYWPELLANDPVFKAFNIYVYEYDSPLLGATYTIDGVAKNMHSVLENANILEQDNIIFVMHSMGGLVTRKMILKFPEVAKKIKFLYFYSTPTEGSGLAQLASLVSANPQFGNLFPMGGNAFIQSLQSDWVERRLSIPSYCAFEEAPTDGIQVVTRASATALCTHGIEALPWDHISVVKPASPNDIRYITFRNAFVASQKREAASARRN